MPKERLLGRGSFAPIHLRITLPAEVNFSEGDHRDDDIRPMPKLDEIKSTVLRIEGTAEAIAHLPHLLDALQPTMVYVAFAGHPEIGDARLLAFHVLQLIGERGSNIPSPVIVGLEQVEPDWQDTFQRGMAMDGIAGFFRDGASHFATRFSSRLIDAPQAIPGLWRDRSEAGTSAIRKR